MSKTGTTEEVRESDQPWSHRQIGVVRYLITILAGILSAVIGTGFHRAGAAYNIPYGMVLALLLVGMSAWCARSRDGVFGLAVHIIASTLTIYIMAVAGPGGDIMVPIGFHDDSLSWFAQNAGYMWMFGATIVQVVLLCCPKSFFRIESKTAPSNDSPSHGVTLAENGR